eukprot:m.58528 g.58528  ORF g.58528 m.58528 type:complete len:311 (-) comp7153_c0_seq2:169-1101(-)
MLRIALLLALLSTAAAAGSAADHGPSDLTQEELKILADEWLQRFGDFGTPEGLKDWLDTMEDTCQFFVSSESKPLDRAALEGSMAAFRGVMDGMSLNVQRYSWGRNAVAVEVLASYNCLNADTGSHASAVMVAIFNPSSRKISAVYDMFDAREFMSAVGECAGAPQSARGELPGDIPAAKLVRIMDATTAAFNDLEHSDFSHFAEDVIYETLLGHRTESRESFVAVMREMLGKSKIRTTKAEPVFIGHNQIANRWFTTVKEAGVAGLSGFIRLQVDPQTLLVTHVYDVMDVNDMERLSSIVAPDYAHEEL